MTTTPDTQAAKALILAARDLRKRARQTKRLDVRSGLTQIADDLEQAGIILREDDHHDSTSAQPSRRSLMTWSEREPEGRR